MVLTQNTNSTVAGAEYSPLKINNGNSDSSDYKVKCFSGRNSAYHLFTKALIFSGLILSHVSY